MNTFIVSDMHLADAQPVDPKRPLWKTYKQRKFFIDKEFGRFIDYVLSNAESPMELVLNGDIFDFDDILQLPEKPEGPIDWLARRRGLGTEEWMSAFKMRAIISDHPEWFTALSKFVRAGHRAIFVIGNHDVELHWPKVQQCIRDALNLGAPESEERVESEKRVVFCNWFYLSQSDTYISHGNQYDRHCTMVNPIDPLIRIGGTPQVRIPFGDLACRYMLGGMGYFNPHVTSNYIMTGVQYVRFFFRYMLLAQPLLLWTWFWGAMVTLVVSLRHFWSPALSDPLLVDEKVQSIAERSQATPSMVRKLQAVNVPSALHSPYLALRELWLDRGLLLLIIFLAAFQVILTINFVWPVSPIWVLVPLALAFPFFLMYHLRVRSSVFAEPLLPPEYADLIFKITGAKNVVFGHTHIPEAVQIGPVYYINGGSWSPAFSDPECKVRIGTQTFVSIRPQGVGARRAELLEWPPEGQAPRPFPFSNQEKTLQAA